MADWNPQRRKRIREPKPAPQPAPAPVVAAADWSRRRARYAPKEPADLQGTAPLESAWESFREFDRQAGTGLARSFPGVETGLNALGVQSAPPPETGLGQAAYDVGKLSGYGMQAGAGQALMAPRLAQAAGQSSKLLPTLGRTISEPFVKNPARAGLAEGGAAVGGAIGAVGGREGAEAAGYPELAGAAEVLGAIPGGIGGAGVSDIAGNRAMRTLDWTLRRLARYAPGGAARRQAYDVPQAREAAARAIREALTLPADHPDYAVAMEAARQLELDIPGLKLNLAQQTGDKGITTLTQDLTRHNPKFTGRVQMQAQRARQLLDDELRGSAPGTPEGGAVLRSRVQDAADAHLAALDDRLAQESARLQALRQDVPDRGTASQNVSRGVEGMMDWHKTESNRLYAPLEELGDKLILPGSGKRVISRMQTYLGELDPADANELMTSGALNRAPFKTLVELPESPSFRNLKKARESITAELRRLRKTQAPGPGERASKQLLQVAKREIDDAMEASMQSGQILTDADPGQLRAIWDEARRVEVSGTQRVGEFIDAWHASPHEFDQFATDAIGTGEGAAAYGHGLYFAEERGVANDYFERFALEGQYEEPISTLRVRGDRPIYKDGQAQNYSPRPGEGSVRATLVENALIEEGDLRLAYFRDGPEGVRELMLKQARAQRAAYVDEWPEGVPEVDAWIRKLERPGSVDIEIPNQTPSMYRVRLKTKPENLLDWDKPLSEQPEVVQVALKKMGVYGQGDLTGADIIRGRAGSVTNAEGVVLTPEQALREAGIPGIRYHDQMSRGKPAGARDFSVGWADDGKRAAVRDAQSGDAVQEFASFKEADAWVSAQADTRTSNFVIFDDSLVEVVERNGKAAPGDVAGEVLEQYKRAQGFYRAGKQALTDKQASPVTARATAGKTAPSDVASAYANPGGRAYPERVDEWNRFRQWTRASGRTDELEALDQGMRQHLLRSAYEESGFAVEGQAPKPQALQNWLRRNSPMLEQYPDVALHLQNVDTAGQAFAQAGLQHKISTRDFQRSVAGRFLGKEPVDAIDAVLKSSDPESAAAELLMLTGNDPDAVQGLKRAVWDRMMQDAYGDQIENATDVLVRERQQIQPGAILKYLSRYEPMLRTYWGDEHYGNMQKIARLSKIAERTGEAGTTRADTELFTNLNGAGQVYYSRLVNSINEKLTEDKPLRKAAGWVLQAIFEKFPQKEMLALLEDATLDPTFAQALLSRPQTAQETRALSQRIAQRLAVAFADPQQISSASVAPVAATAATQGENQ